MWLFNAGYIIYELAEMEVKRKKYFGLDSVSNVFDVIISINWIILAILRFGARLFKSSSYFEIDILLKSETTNTSTSGAFDGRDNHNAKYTVVFMGLWSIQIIVLWIRVIGLLQRTEIMGPLLRMSMNIISGVLNFFVLLIFRSTGFVFAMFYIVGGDLDRDLRCGDLVIDATLAKCQEVEQPLNGIRSTGYT